MKEQIKKLNQKLLSEQEAYYSGNPIVSDAEYDADEALLSSMIAKFPQYAPAATVLKHVGQEYSTEKRIRHDFPMLSIENYYTEEDFLKATEHYGKHFLVEPKRDGISAELKFSNGKLYEAVTRGDGMSGEDMTLQVKVCKTIPQTIKNCPVKNLRIRGELVMRKSELARINNELLKEGKKIYSNSRNLTAGTMKHQDLSIVSDREILLIPWDVYSPDEDNLLPDSAYERMKLVEKFGFPLYEGILADRDHIMPSLHTILHQNSENDIEADGVVVKANSFQIRKKLGVATKYTKYQHCFKPQNLAAETELLDIEYQVGRTGKITPVAILKEVDLGGAIITRASVCNETYMNALGLKIGCTVRILRSGNVIPFIESVVRTNHGIDIVFPTHCPSCGTNLLTDKKSDVVQHFCPNSRCTGQAIEYFTYIANRKTLEIDCLGPELAKAIIQYTGANNAADLFEFGNILNSSSDFSKYESYFRSVKNLSKMAKSLEKAKHVTWERWIATLDIPFIGHSLGKDIAILFELKENDMKYIPQILLEMSQQEVSKIGPEKMKSIINWASDKNNQMLCERLYKAGVRPTSLVKEKKMKGQKLDGVVFCITGTLVGGKRKEVEAKLESLGATAVSNITSACNLLIVGEDAGNKLEKAKKKGIKIVDELWVDEVIGN